MVSPSKPFHPARFPFYYGWVILICATLGMITAVPGSPAGLSPFLDPMADTYGIQRSHFTLAYMLGTIFAGIATWRASALFDRWDSRLLGSAAIFLLGLSLVFMGTGHHLYRMLLGPETASVFVATALLAFSFFCIRFLGLGVMMTLTRSMIIRWFVRHRSLAVSLNGAAVSLSFASAPVLVLIVVENVGWAPAWIVMGLFFSVLVSVLAFLFFRHSPEQVGLEPPVDIHPSGDGSAPTTALPHGELRFPVYRDFSASEATRTAAFWIVVSTLAFNGVVATGIILNLVAFGVDQGLSERHTLFLMFPSAFINIAVTLSLGAIGHKTDMKWVLLLLLLGLFNMVIGAANLGTTVGQVAFVVGGGFSWGSFGILLSLPWPRYFGLRHIGSINGYVSAFTIVASATGPFVFGLVRDATGSFNAAIGGCLFLFPVLFIACLTLKNPQDGFAPRS